MNINFNTSVQDAFLNKKKEQQAPLVIYIKNGYQVRGRIIDLDDETILLQGEENEQLVYKHAISTISEVNLSNDTMASNHRHRW